MNNHIVLDSVVANESEPLIGDLPDLRYRPQRMQLPALLKLRQSRLDLDVHLQSPYSYCCDSVFARYFSKISELEVSSPSTAGVAAAGAVRVSPKRGARTSIENPCPV